MRKNMDQNNSEYGHFLRSDSLHSIITKIIQMEETKPCVTVIKRGVEQFLLRVHVGVIKIPLRTIYSA